LKISERHISGGNATQTEMPGDDLSNPTSSQGKFAMKSIVAEIDAKAVESGSIGGRLWISESIST